MKMLTFLSSILLSYLCMANAAAPELSSLLDRDGTQPMPKGYIKSAHPYQEENKATRVDFDFHLKGLPRVDLKKQEIEVDMVLGLTWDDPRLKNISNNNPDFSFIKVSHSILIIFLKISWQTIEFDAKDGSYYFFPGEKAKELWVPDIFLDKTPNIRFQFCILYLFFFFVNTIGKQKSKKIT